MTDRMASPLARVQGLGSAREGAREWWLHRLSAVALVPLALWWVVTMIAHAGMNYPDFINWIRDPLPAILLVLTNAVLFYHLSLGLQSVIEDYIHHEGAKLGSLVLVKFGCVVLAVAGIFSVLRIAFGG
jgi:succinate dehydrogenase / fumarate reductase membrane anchor subunit